MEKLKAILVHVTTKTDDVFGGVQTLEGIILKCSVSLRYLQTLNVHTSVLRKYSVFCSENVHLECSQWKFYHL